MLLCCVGMFDWRPSQLQQFTQLWRFHLTSRVYMEPKFRYSETSCSRHSAPRCTLLHKVLGFVTLTKVGEGTIPKKKVLLSDRCSDGASPCDTSSSAPQTSEITNRSSCEQRSCDRRRKRLRKHSEQISYITAVGHMTCRLLGNFI